MAQSKGHLSLNNIDLIELFSINISYIKYEGQVNENFYYKH